MRTHTNRELFQEAELQGTTAITADSEVIADEEAAKEREGKMRYVNIQNISGTNTLRLNGGQDTLFESKKFKALKEAIKVEGIITPLVVAKVERSRKLTLIDGQRRLEAARLLGLETVPVIIYDENHDAQELLNIMSNSHHKQPTPIELGFAYKRLREKGVYESNRELAEALGISESNVGTRINNLKLDKRIIDDLLHGNGINDQKVLKAIRTFSPVDENGTSEQQRNLFNHIVENSLGRKEALEYIKSEREPEIVSERIVSLAQNNVIDLHIDTSGLDEERRAKIHALIEEIEAIRQEAEVAAA